MHGWAELQTGLAKKYDCEYEMARKIGEGILTSQNRKKKIKIQKDFLAAKN
jgi:hypothetical protein